MVSTGTSAMPVGHVCIWYAGRRTGVLKLNGTISSAVVSMSNEWCLVMYFC